MKKVIFIGGSSYSGSTMLDMMMANQPTSFSAGEVYALFNPYRPHHFQPACGCGEPNCNFWEKVHNAGENNLYRTIFSLLPNLDIIVDSSKDPWWIKKQTTTLEKQGITVYNLLIYKEPAAFAHSMLKRNRKRWKRAWINYYKLYFSLVTNYIPVAYSELAKQPSVTINKLCNQCGIEPHNKQEEFWNKQHHTLFGNDSAKIHTYNCSSDNYQKCKDIINTQDPQNQTHRKIYHDVSYQENIPSEILLEIQNNIQIRELLSVLTDNMGGSNPSAIYTPTEFLFKNISHFTRIVIGRTLGRYWRLF